MERLSRVAKCERPRCNPMARRPSPGPPPAGEQSAGWSSQVEREREVRIALFLRDRHGARRVTEAEETREATRFGFVRVDREGAVGAPARMGHVVLAAAHGTAHPAVDEV